MVGYGPPIFYGRPGEDPENWLRDMQRYIIASRINVAPGAGQAPGREEAFGLVVSCLAGDALNWYNTRVKVRGLAAGNGGGQIGALNTAGEFQGKAAAEIGRIGAGIATGADIIPNGTWDEDWSIAGGEPVDNAPVAPNAGGNLPVVTIAPGIKLGQLLYLFRTAYTTVEHLKQTAVFGQLMQGDMSVEQFSARTKKVGKLAEMTPEQQREQFIPLAEAEKFTLSQKSAPSSLPIFPTANPYADTNRSGGGMTKNEIEDLIKTTMASSQPQTAQQNTDLQSSIKSLQETMSQATKTLDNKMSSAKLREIPLEETIRKVLHSELKLIFPPHFFQDSGLIASKQIVASTEAKIVSQNDVSLSSKDSDESSLEEESLDDPMEINFVKKKEPKTSVATVKCKIRHLKIPAMTLDSGAEPPIITENIVERVGDKIDKSEIHDLEGISTVPVKSVGVVRNLPITLAPGLTIHEDFVVVRSELGY
ncbi:hypothetical protein GLOIN_2v1886689 [Rhizophagus irregularis DAOM 181602=DAOM 197198]|nr:hypothetical protein GLOIN_2v1886689 [Rhizophagus irregularis DAOM 181602=DAOM 197198]